jgi:hypothetical protein
MKFLVINTEAFSPKGLKAEKKLTFDNLPWVVRTFLSAFPKNFTIVDEVSKIKCTAPVKESAKSSRARLIKLLGKYAGEKCIMTGTLMPKSPLNVIDPYSFLQEDYFPENVWEFAERYCVMTTIRVGRGRRVIIGQKDYAEIRKRLINAYNDGGEARLNIVKENIFKQYAISYGKQEHIMRHKRYTPFLNYEELISRIAPVTMFVNREDVFDITFDRFVKEPIMRPVELPEGSRKLANELIELGFTDRLTLGKAPALELIIRLQDICNGFEPVDISGDKSEHKVTHRALPENPKIVSLLGLLEEIDVEHNQVVVWASRKLMIRACAEAFDKTGYSYVIYDGSSGDSEKEEAKEKFKKQEVQIFLANQASGAFGLNCLAGCSYAVYMCVDGSVEKYVQSRDRILRGQLYAPKFAYGIYVKGSVEERQWEALRVGRELLEAENSKEKFIFK